jgi:hypothetical protein
LTTAESAKIAKHDISYPNEEQAHEDFGYTGLLSIFVAFVTFVAFVMKNT